MSEEETTNYVEGTNMTEQELVDGYVEKAANESLEAADNWVKETLGGQPTQDMMIRLGPLVLAKMKDQGLIPDDAQVQGDESSTEATQLPEEAYGQPAEGTQEEASESNTEATEEAPEAQED